MTRRRTLLVVTCSASALAVALLLAAPFLLAEDASGPQFFTATSANVVGAPDAVRFEILRWSTDQEREKLLAAWQLKSAADGGGRGAGKGAAKAGRGAAKGGDAPAASAPAALIPEGELAKSLQEAATVGYLWTSELSGYALRYAGKMSATGGTQRIILITQRRLGAMNQKWALASGTPNNHEFSVIELRLNAKGEGEGRASLLGKLVADPAAKIVALENYESLPVVFRDVRAAAKQPGANQP